MYLQIDTVEDKEKDKMRRGGPERKGDMTRLLKNKKVNWLFKYWWYKEAEFVWNSH